MGPRGGDRRVKRKKSPADGVICGMWAVKPREQGSSTSLKGTKLVGVELAETSGEVTHKWGPGQLNLCFWSADRLHCVYNRKARKAPGGTKFRETLKGIRRINLLIEKAKASNRNRKRVGGVVLKRLAVLNETGRRSPN